jgi:hypothetical protein
MHGERLRNGPNGQAVDQSGNEACRALQQEEGFEGSTGKFIPRCMTFAEGTDQSLVTLNVK